MELQLPIIEGASETHSDRSPSVNEGDVDLRQTYMGLRRVDDTDADEVEEELPASEEEEENLSDVEDEAVDFRQLQAVEHVLHAFKKKEFPILGNISERSFNELRKG